MHMLCYMYIIKTYMLEFSYSWYYNDLEQKNDSNGLVRAKKSCLELSWWSINIYRLPRW